MKVNYSWLQKYFDKKLPSVEEVAESLTFKAFEIESIEKLGKDTIIDIDVLPNRASDSLSHYGIAKELSVIFGLPLKNDIFKEKINLFPESKLLSVKIEDEKVCRRFTGAVLKNIKVKESPDWLKKSLESLGQKSINNIVDATNYVMFDIGQPLHAFDLYKLKEDNGKYNITVRMALDKEEITTLTGDKYILSNKNLLITDGNNSKALAIAGIKGGKIAEVDDGTKNIIIECANFNPINIRRSSKFLKLRTDASTRFENNISTEVPHYGITNVVKLIQDIAGGDLEGYVDVYSRKQPTYKVGVSLGEVNKLLGSKIEEYEIENILNEFSFEYEKVAPREKIIELSKNLEGVPYKYGASITNDAPNYFDCSSFTGYLFVQAGIAIPRVAIDQYVFGEEVKKNDIKPGDLVFSTNGNGSSKEYKFTMLSSGFEVIHKGPKEETFEFSTGTKVKGGVSHCGIYIGSGEVIHASSDNGVVIEKIKESKHFKNVVGYRKIINNNDYRYVVIVPFERRDIKIKEDLIEEVGRIYGYEKIKPVVPDPLSTKIKVNKNFYYAEKIRGILTQRGFTEVYTYSFRDRGEVEIINVLSGDNKFLREELSSGIEKALNLNIKNAPLLGLENVNIFEIGKVFNKDSEYISLAIGIQSSDLKKNEKETYFTLEKEMNLFFEKLNISERSFNEIGLYDGKVLQKSVAKSGEILEINFDKLIKKLPNPNKYNSLEKISEGTIYSSISQYPFVLRDIAIWVPINISIKKVTQTILNICARLGAAGATFVRITPFDKYEKVDKMSYAFHLVFQSSERTLFDEDVNKVMDEITRGLNNQEGWKVR